LWILNVRATIFSAGKAAAEIDSTPPPQPWKPYASRASAFDRGQFFLPENFASRSDTVICP